MTSINSLSSISAKTGIGGLISGMDIDQLVESLTSASREKILKQQNNIQNLKWKQTGYRSVTAALKSFQNSYLDILSTTNFRSTSFFNTVKAASSSVAISVSAMANASAGTITINEVTQLATNQKLTSTSPISESLAGTLECEAPGTLTGSDISSLLSEIAHKSIGITLDGKFKTVTFDIEFIENVNKDLSADGLAVALQQLTDNAFGVKDPADRIINVSITGDQLSFTADGSQITVMGVGELNTLSKLGLSNLQSNKVATHKPLNEISFFRELEDVDTYKLSVNSIEFEFSKSESLSTVLNKINASSAGVTVSYSSITDTISMSANESGVGENIVINETQGNLMSVLGLTQDVGANVIYGTNAILTVNGQDIVRSSNSINIDGVNIELLETTGESSPPITVTMKEDTTSLIEPIKNFINDYNLMIDLINGLTKESVYADFQPLSDEQKDGMTETQIEKWEEKARSGLLRGDRLLRSIALKFQTTMLSSAVMGGITLYNMGITSTGYQENGKLKINESKLTEILKTNSHEVKEFFTSPESGLANKLNDIITGLVKTTGVEGERGALVEIAGVDSTTSDTRNNISKSIESTNKQIESLKKRLTDEETRLWRQFTAMETALQRLNEQSAILMQFSGGYNNNR